MDVREGKKEERKRADSSEICRQVAQAHLGTAWSNYREAAKAKLDNSFIISPICYCQV